MTTWNDVMTNVESPTLIADNRSILRPKKRMSDKFMVMLNFFSKELPDISDFHIVKEYVDNDDRIWLNWSTSDYPVEYELVVRKYYSDDTHQMKSEFPISKDEIGQEIFKIVPNTSHAKEIGKKFPRIIDKCGHRTLEIAESYLAAAVKECDRRKEIENYNETVSEFVLTKK